MAFKRATLQEFRAELGRVKCPCAGWSDCIQFAGTRGTNGYNLFRTILPSTVAAYLVAGRFPSTVVHRCGNKNCVNFAHMGIHYFVDTPGVSVKAVDRVSKSLSAPTLQEVFRVLRSRPETGKRYNVSDLVLASGVANYGKVRQALRYAPVIDVADDAAVFRGKVNMDSLLIPVDEPLPVEL